LDQRRFVLFLALSMLLFLLAQMLFPPPVKKPAPAGPAAGGPADGKGQPPENGAAKEDEGKAPPLEGEQAAAAKPQAAVPQVAAVAEPTQFVTLGSLDPDSGYRMLVTLTNTGASIRRAEMSSPRFLDQHDRSGYLGELELASVDGGVKVQVVVAGTPAAAPTADFKPGDVIVGI
jgi:YidC/Oxa1 family membrane protein insertase